MSRHSLAAAPNSRLHPFDTAVPGFLPRLSKSAVQKAVLAAAALHCSIPRVSRFERKHYAYADLPHSYQITQQRWPLATQGILRGAEFECGIERIQLESDTAKTLTSGAPSAQALIDYNRAGCALIEIVTAPGLRSAHQAAAAVAQVRQLLRHALICQGQMQLGQLRVDVNINLQRLRDARRNARVEVKNLNSLQQVRRAIDYEAVRQAEAWEARAASGQGGAAEETRTWDVAQARTVLLRTKDAADDYRFLPEPDLPPVVMNESVFDGMSLEAFLAQHLPELPSAAVERLQRDHGLSEQVARVIASDPPAIRFLDEAMQLAPKETRQKHEFGKIATSLLVNELFALVKQPAAMPAADGDDEPEASVANCPISGQQLGKLALMQYEGTVSSTMAKRILSIMNREPSAGTCSPSDVAAQHGLQLLSDPAQLLALCHEVIAQHPEQLNLYCQGGKFVNKMKKLFAGKAMTASRGNAHPERLQEALNHALEEAATATKASRSDDQKS